MNHLKCKENLEEENLEEIFNGQKMIICQAKLDAANTLEILFKRQVKKWLAMDFHTMRESMAKFMNS